MIRICIAILALAAFFLFLAPGDQGEVESPQEQIIEITADQWAEIATRFGDEASADQLTGGRPSGEFRDALSRFGVDPDDFQARARAMCDHCGRLAQEDRDEAFANVPDFDLPEGVSMPQAYFTPSGEVDNHHDLVSRLLAEKTRGDGK